MHPPHTPYHDRLAICFQRLWAFGLAPDWQDFLGDEAARSIQHIQDICRNDLNWRLIAETTLPTIPPLRSIVNDVYKPVLSHELQADEWRSMARCEYQLRWHCGLQTSAEDFANCLDTSIRPERWAIEWICPDQDCGTAQEIRHDAVSDFPCCRCGRTWTTSQVFPKPISPWIMSNAPRWMLQQLAVGARIVGSPGTYGTAFAVQDRDMHDQETIVKVLHPRWTHFPSIVERFMRESRILARLDGEGTPYLRRVGRLPDGRYYYQMQWIDGCELRDCVKEMEMQPLLERFEDIVRAIAVAHASGILHRDISPRNIVVETKQRFRAVVLDWGQGRIQSEDAAEVLGTLNEVSALDNVPNADPTRTDDRNIFGSHGFCAPELVHDPTRATMASDVFSLGALLLYCLTHGKENASNRENAIKAIETLRRQEPIAAEVELIDLLDKCLRSDPTQRPASAVIIADSLRHWHAERQRRVETVPIVKARNRLAWSLVGVLGIGTLCIAALTIAWHARSDQVLRAERALSAQREQARQDSEVFSAAQAKLAEDKSREAKNAKAFSSLLIDVFKSTDPLGLEGSGYRSTAESVLEMNAVDLLQRVARRISMTEFETQEARAIALDAVGNALRGLGQAQEAEAMLLEAEAIQKSPSYQGNPEDYISLHFHLALLHHDIRDLVKGEEYYKRTLELMDRFPVDSNLRSQVQFRYAWLLAEAQRAREAYDLFKEVKEQRVQTFGADHRETQLVDLAVVLASLNTRNSSQLLQSIQQLPATNSALVELIKAYVPVVVLRKAGWNDRAERGYEQLLTTAERILPPHHPLLGLLLGDMAGFLRKIGKQDQAVKLAERALEVARRTIPTHPYSLELFRELGKQYENSGRHSDAEAIYREMLGYLSHREGGYAADSKQEFEKALHRIESIDVR